MWTRICTSLLFVFPLASYADSAEWDDFPKWQEDKKSQVVWQLDDKRMLKRPECKPIFRDLLFTKGAFTHDNSPNFLYQSIEMAEQQKWRDFDPLIQALYDGPPEVWTFKSSFQYLRRVAEKPVAPKLEQAFETLSASGEWGSTLSDAELAGAVALLKKQEDKDALLVYALKVACWHSGKGGTDRGRLAAIEVLRSLDVDRVKKQIAIFRKFFRYRMHREEMEWIAKQLAIP
ncbi:MAG: hypothetical protein ABSE73_25465 [Planctomycetota bacterium]